MSGNNSSRKVVTVDEQAFERPEDAGVDEEGFEVVDDRPEFRATVQQETQAKVDSNHPDGIVQDFSHLPLAQEEKIRAREAELEHISAQAELGTQEGRAQRTREVVTERRQRKREERTPERTDPRERLSRMELAKVNQEADRMAQRLRTGHSRAAVSRALAKRVAKGQDITEAVFDTMDALKAAPGAICPIEDVPDVQTDEVSVDGTVIELWIPSTPNVQQVGLIADDTAATKFTVWRKSDCTAVAEGERVRLRAAKVNWHQGRWSLALTYDSMIVFPDRDDRWGKNRDVAPSFSGEFRTDPSPAAPPTAPCSLPAVAARTATTSGTGPTFISETGGIGVRPESVYPAPRGVRAHECSGVRMTVEGDYTCDICGESFERNVDIAAHVQSHQSSIDPDHILAELTRVADQKGRAPTQPEFNEEADCTHGAVQSHFGSWKAGLEAAGLEPLSHSHSEQELIEELQRVAEVVGHSPSVTEMDTEGTVSSATISERFGSWNEGLEAAGLATTKATKTSPQEVVKAIRSLADELGRAPTATEMEKCGAYSTKVAQRRFGSWNAALRESGFEPLSKKNVPEDELIAELRRLRDELGHVPSSTEMHEHGEFTMYLYLDRFGSWKQAVEAAGMEYRGQPSGPDHPLWKGGYGDISYGPNWYKQRKRALERDGFECQMPECSIDRETHRERWDRDLNVHHITPLGTFIDADGVLDYERANRLENLITLCQRHHMLWEEFAPLQPDIR